MEQDEHQQRQHSAEVVQAETADHQVLLRNPTKSTNDTPPTSASRQQQEGVVTLGYKRSIDERDKSNENVGMIPAGVSSVVQEEGRDEDSKRRKGSSTTTTHSTSFAIIDDRDYHHRPSVAFTKSTDTRDNELSPVGSACGGSTPFTRKGPEALVQRLEDEERIVFVPTEHQQQQQQSSTASTFGFRDGALNALQERDEISPCFAGGDPLAISEDIVYSTVLHDTALSPLMERDHIAIIHESPAQSYDADSDSLSLEDVFIGPDATGSAVEKTETSLLVEIPQCQEEVPCLNVANVTHDDEAPALATKPEADATATGPSETESNWVAEKGDPPRWVVESFVALAMAPQAVEDHALEQERHQQQISKIVDNIQPAVDEQAVIQPIVVTASGTIKTERDAVVLALGAAASFASDDIEIESGPVANLDGANEPATMLVRARAVSDSFLLGSSALETTDSVTLKRTVSEPLLGRNASVSPVQGNGPAETSLSMQEDDDAKLKEEQEGVDPATVDYKVGAAMMEGRQSSAFMTDQDMNIKIDAARKASLSTSVGAFSEIDPRAAFELKDKMDEKRFLVDIPVQSEALSPSDSTDVEMAFARAAIGTEHTPNTSSPGAYHEGGNRGINMGFSHSRGSSSSTLFSSDETIDAEPAPLTAQLVDEDKLRLQAERDAEEALRRLMDQAVQGQAIVIGDEDGELHGELDSSDKRKKEQPRKLYRRSLALAFILICGLVVTVVMLTRPDEDQPPPAEPAVVPETWMQMGTDIDGEQPNESWGSSVALSANATMLAGGKPMPYITIYAFCQP
jgi:hypothetical protein